MRFPALLLALSLAGPAAAEEPRFATGDAEIDAAIAAARETLPVFLENAVLGEGAVKVALPLAGGGHEQVWVAPFRAHPGGGFEGVLAADASAIDALKKGARIEFEAEAITDWSAVIAGRGYGYFTLRAILDRVDPDRARVLNLFLADTPLPSDWR